MVYLASLCYTWDTFPISHLIPSKHVLFILQFCTLNAVDEKSQKNLLQYSWSSWDISLLPILSTPLFGTTDLFLCRARYESRVKIRLSPAQSKGTVHCSHGQPQWQLYTRHLKGSHSFKSMLWLVQHYLSAEQSVNAIVPPAMASTKLTREDLLLTNQPSQNCSDIMSSKSSQSSGKCAVYHSITTASTRASRVSEVPQITDTFRRSAPQNCRSVMLLIC